MELATFNEMRARTINKWNRTQNDKWAAPPPPLLRLYTAKEYILPIKKKIWIEVNQLPAFTMAIGHEVHSSDRTIPFNASKQT